MKFNPIFITTKRKEAPMTYALVGKTAQAMLLFFALAMNCTASAFSQTVMFATNAGGQEYTFSGVRYAADSLYAGGSTWQHWDNNLEIRGTSEDALYRSHRYGDFSYDIALANGTYDVTLKFVELGYSMSGARKFDVAIEGQTVLDDFDIIAQSLAQGDSGYAWAVDRVVQVIVNDGELNISFISETGSPPPLVSAIAVRGTSSSQPPTITSHPSNQSVQEGNTATFAVAATGNPAPSYQWQKNNVNIGGATSASYTTPATVLSDNGSTFRCVVSNTVGSLTSNSATLTVTAAPQAPAITVHPTNQSVAAGQNATFSVSATGSAPLTYQWKKNGADVGINATSYTLSTTLGDSGSLIHCVVSNAYGSATSNTATLTVTSSPPPTSGEGYIKYHDSAGNPQNSKLYQKDGLIGFNTQTPSNDFSVNGNFTVENSAAQITSMGVSKAGSIVEFNSDLSKAQIVLGRIDGHGRFNIENRDGQAIYFSKSGDLMVINSDGNVGIGASDPTDKLQVLGGISSGLADSLDGKITLYSQGSFGSYNISSTNQNYLRFFRKRTDGTETENMTFDANGNVGIGIANPRTRLMVSGAPNISGSGSVGSLLETFDTTATGFNTAYGGIAFGSTPGYDFSIGKKTVNNSTYLQMRRQDGLELMTLDAAGKVGIGRNDPDYTLDVKGQLRLDNSPQALTTLRLENASIMDLSVGAAGGYLASDHILAFHAGGSERMIVTSDGYVGIGTTNPGKLLHLHGAAGASNIMITSSTSSANGRIGVSGSDDGFMQLANNQGAQTVALNASGTSYFNGGNVGIGTNSPTSKLDVNGTIKATEIIVALSSGADAGGDDKKAPSDAKGKPASSDADDKATAKPAGGRNGWPDFVFASDYSLMSLDELAQAIKDQKRLPGIPSAQEVETHGLNLGEMQAMLLQKIEELTLYLIDLKKENESLKNRVSEIERK
jgi:hypothetical protein